MVSRRFVLALLACAPCLSFADGAKEASKSVALFDGKTLAGWEGNEKSFRVSDGAIVAGTLKERIPQNEFLCTKKQYEDFELRLKVKVLGDGVNAGIQVRTKRIPNHHEVIGYQADVGEGWWGKLYDESRRNKILAGEDNSKLVKKDDWNEYVIRCKGNHIQLFLNGKKTVDYKEMDAKIERKGVIAVQIHAGPPSEAWYKDISIQEL
ncbi:MAG: DUF1080 domain-containing protein [Planctomycetales bacterium]|nr:DUF1080 domain-containing protein [Planctomycetales bacterium]